MGNLTPWGPEASPQAIRASFDKPGLRLIPAHDQKLAAARRAGDARSVIDLLITKALLLNSEAETAAAYQILEEARTIAVADDTLATEKLTTLFYFQGVTAMRRGENDNCVMCRGESSCILPIAPAAVHTNPAGSRLAIRHFTEIPRAISRRPRGPLAAQPRAHDAGRTPGRRSIPGTVIVARSLLKRRSSTSASFATSATASGVNRFNQAGGAIMEDFDNDGLSRPGRHRVRSRPSRWRFTATRATAPSTERTEAAGLTGPARRAELRPDRLQQRRPPGHLRLARRLARRSRSGQSLLRNNGDGTFTDVTAAGGPARTPSTPTQLSLGRLRQRRLARRLRLLRAAATTACITTGATARSRRSPPRPALAATRQRVCCKGATWIDYDNDDYPDLFVNNYQGRRPALSQQPRRHVHRRHDGPWASTARARASRAGRGTTTTTAGSTSSPPATTDRSQTSSRACRPAARPLSRTGCSTTRAARRFEDVTKEAGLDLVFATMGSNFGDFDNDGFLDYLPRHRRSRICARWSPTACSRTSPAGASPRSPASSGTGHLQKGHGVACGDWDRDGDIDIFIEMGGAVNGDKYHNILFQNPGQGNHWLTVKLVGKKTNRAAIGARIKVVTAGRKAADRPPPRLIGQQLRGQPAAADDRPGPRPTASPRLEIHWPTSGTTQVFRDIAADQAIEITEFATDYRRLPYARITPPAPSAAARPTDPGRQRSEATP